MRGWTSHTRSRPWFQLMIDLQIRASLAGERREPFVVKLLGADECPPDSASSAQIGRSMAQGTAAVFQTKFGALSLDADETSITGDVLLVQPSDGIAQRWFRRGDAQNTLLITERCDQLCIMCSQPPKKSHTDNFRYFHQACLLADEGADVGLSGGEPTLFKDQLFALISGVASARPDLTFHVLTNAQHFERSDLAMLASMREHVIWGVPIYSADPVTHDTIVAKPGAFERLQTSLALLSEANAAVEIRTVLMKQTVSGLPRLACWLSARFPDAFCWAIMQLEQQGFARGRWAEQFFDHSSDFMQIGDAVSIALARGLTTHLYNVPRCTIPEAFRDLAPVTISDWKREYLDDCANCRDRELCSGLFAWHGTSNPYATWGAL